MEKVARFTSENGTNTNAAPATDAPKARTGMGETLRRAARTTAKVTATARAMAPMRAVGRITTARLSEAPTATWWRLVVPGWRGPPAMRRCP